MPEALSLPGAYFTNYQSSSCLGSALLLHGGLNWLFRLLWFWNWPHNDLRRWFCARDGFGCRGVVNHCWFPFVDWPLAAYGYRKAVAWGKT